MLHLATVGLVMATLSYAVQREASFFNTEDCSGDHTGYFYMNNDGCFHVGHKLSYKTGAHDIAKAAAGGWCLIMYADDKCEQIDDYQWLELDKGPDVECHSLAPNPYHGSYHWQLIGEDGKCPVRGTYEGDQQPVWEVPDPAKKAPHFEYPPSDEDDSGRAYLGPLR